MAKGGFVDPATTFLLNKKSFKFKRQESHGTWFENCIMPGFAFLQGESVLQIKNVPTSAQSLHGSHL